MKAIQERYKDDKPQLQQEMLKLYQEEKINPMAGCLPILLQIPVFYALYKVLMVSVEMRHQPFALWIKDLSAPDPLTPINLFGLLDFTPPSFIADRRPADPARHHHVAAVQAQPGADGPGPAADLQLHAVGDDGRDGAVRGGPAALLGGHQHPDDRAAVVAVQALRHEPAQRPPRCTSPDGRRRRSLRTGAQAVRGADRLPEVRARASAFCPSRPSRKSPLPGGRTSARARCSTR